MSRPPSSSRSLRTTVLALGLALLATASEAHEVVVPLHVDHESLRKLLAAQVYTDPNGTAAVWRDATGCNHLTLVDPIVDGRSGRLRVVTAAQAHIGTAIGAHCLLAVDWTGTIEVLLEPSVAPGVPAIHFRVVDSNVHGGAPGTSSFTGTVWGWVRSYVQPRLETLVVDFGAPLAEIRGALPAFLPGDDAARIDGVLRSLALGEPRVLADGLELSLRFAVPDVVAAGPTPAPTASPSAAAPPEPSEPALSDAELTRMDAALQRWDAFLTFVVKQAAGDIEDDTAHQDLLSVLLDARQEIVAALAGATPGDVDPVRRLFVATWARLRPVLQRLESRVPGDTAFRYLGFVAAGDALRALDEIGPSVGLEISADGLRRLARIVAPTTVEDPLAYDLAVDPALRERVGFGPPLPPPAENPDVDLSAWLIGTAWAAESAADAVADLSARLNRWVPPADEIERYLAAVRDLLHGTSDRVLASGTVEQRWQDLYRTLVLATAWQETCWRQFIKVGTVLKPIRSPLGSVGIMQVNPRVWRGFYDAKGLQRDIAYNAGAGAEILAHYLVDYAIGRADAAPGPSDADELARVTYAVYNGGPSQLRRDRDRKTPARLRAIDELFRDKYRAIRDGNELAVLACYRDAS